MNKIIFQPIGKNFTREDVFNNKSWGVSITYWTIWLESNGDIILFTDRTTIFAVAKIIKIEDDKNSRKYPFRYYWDKINAVNIPLEKFNLAIGYKAKYHPQTYVKIANEESLKKAFEFLRLMNIPI